MTSETNRLLHEAREHAIRRARRDQQPMRIYTGNRHGELCVFVRSVAEGVPEMPYTDTEARLVQTVEPTEGE